MNLKFGDEFDHKSSHSVQTISLQYVIECLCIFNSAEAKLTFSGPRRARGRFLNTPRRVVLACGTLQVKTIHRAPGYVVCLSLLWTLMKSADHQKRFFREIDVSHICERGFIRNCKLHRHRRTNIAGLRDRWWICAKIGKHRHAESYSAQRLAVDILI